MSESGKMTGPPVTGVRPRARTFGFEWPQEEVHDIQVTFRRARSLYLRLYPGRPSRLSLSSYLAVALEVGLRHQAEWLAAVHNDRRTEARSVPCERVRVTWPDDLGERIYERWIALDCASTSIWGEGFALTQAHLVLGGIQYGLLTWKDWLADVPNDGRIRSGRSGPTMPRARIGPSAS